jgi:DNA-binding GntR family transcriptional regulator
MDALVEYRSQLLHEHVADKLREMIITGELSPGAAIDELALCETFKVSRTPLREALKVLAAEELVTLQPRRGAVVSPMTSATVDQKFEVISLIEGHAARTFCERGNKDELAELNAIHARLAAGFKSKSRKQYFESNQRFHRRLVELTGNDEMVRIHRQLITHLQRARYFTGQQKNWRHTFMTEHAEIMAALTEGTPDKAEAAMRSHLAHVAKTVKEVLN